MDKEPSSPQLSSGLHCHDYGDRSTIHTHRTWEEFHGHDSLPVGAGTPLDPHPTSPSFISRYVAVCLYPQGCYPEPVDCAYWISGRVSGCETYRGSP